MDIQPKGFEVIQLDGYATEEAVQKTLRVPDDPALRQQMVDRNFEIARRCYSHYVLKRRMGRFDSRTVSPAGFDTGRRYFYKRLRRNE